MKAITFFTVALFSIIAILAFILSFSALQITAHNNGKAGLLAYAWPLLIDGGLIIFSLAVVYKSLRQESARLQWAMVGLFTVATVGFNVFQASNALVTVLVAASAPIVLFLTFETLMGMIRAGVQRGEYQNRIDDLSLQVKQMQDERQKLQDKIKRLQNKEEKLSTQPLTPEPELSDRQRQIVKLVNSGLDNKAEIARQLSTSRQTVYNEINTLKATGVLTKNGHGLQI